MTPTPAGWYPDTTSPPSAPTLRWWDGTQWTAHVAAAGPPSPTLPQPLTTPDGAALASWGRRLGAWVIDWVITGAVVTAASISIYLSLFRSMTDLVDALDPVTGELPPGAQFTDYFEGFGSQLLLVIAISLAVPMIYHALFLRWWSATPGKRILKLRVRRWDAEGPLSWAPVLKRVLMQYGVFAVLSVVYVHLLDGLWPLWDDRRQSLHDKVASTVVVDVSPVDGS